MSQWKRTELDDHGDNNYVLFERRVNDIDEKDHYRSTNKKLRVDKLWLTRVLLSIGVVLFIIIVLLRQLSRSLSKQSSQYKESLILPKNPLEAYHRRDQKSLPECLPLSRFEFEDCQTVGIDLNLLQPGNLILTEHILKEQDQNAEIDRVNQLFEKQIKHRHYDPLKKAMRQLKPLVIFDSYNQKICGRDRPRHTLMAVSVPHEPPFTTERVILWDFKISTGWYKTSLKDYLKKEPLTSTKYWLIRLNRSASTEILQSIEEDFFTSNSLNKPKSTVSAFTSIMTRGSPLIIRNRTVFFNQVRTIGEKIIASSNQQQMKWMNPTDFSAALLDLEMSNSFIQKYYKTFHQTLDKTAISSILRSWRQSCEWKGLFQDGYSCASLFYAVLERCGLTMRLCNNLGKKMQERINCEDTKPLSQQMALIKSDEDNEKMAIIAPQNLHPCDYSSDAFQWADDVFVQYASRFWIDLK